MNLGLNYHGTIFLKNVGGVIRKIASYKSVKIHCVAAHGRFSGGECVPQ